MKRILDIFQTALVCVLLVSMTCLSVIYMMSYRSSDSSEFTPQMDLAVRETLYKAEYVKLLSETLFSPYFVGFSISGERMGFIGESASEAYGDINKLVLAFLSPASSAKRVDEAEFALCMKRDFAYVKYNTDLKRSVIYSICSPDDMLNSVGDEYISELFIVFGSELSAVARSSNGDCYKYTCSEADVINKNSEFSYNRLEGGYDFSFGAEYAADDVMIKNGFYEKISDTAVFFDGDVKLSSAVIELGREIDADGAANMLQTLGMNPEKVTYHENDEGITYFGEGQNLTVRSVGAFDFSVSSSKYGLSMSSLIGYNVSQSDYSVLDGIGAALVLAKTLGISDMGDLSLVVTCAAANGNEMTIGLSYSYMGVIAADDGEYALKISINDGYIISASGFFASARAYDGYTTSENVMWQVRSYLYSSNVVSDLRFIYKMENSRLRLAFASCFERGGDDT